MNNPSLRMSTGTKEDVAAIFTFLVDNLYPAVGIFPIDPAAAVAEITMTCRTGAVTLVEKGGELLGTYGIVLAPVWYNPVERIINDVWWCVKKGEDRLPVTRMMVRELRAMVDATGRPATVIVQDGHRRGRVMTLVPHAETKHVRIEQDEEDVLSAKRAVAGLH